ncbi:hypothetical protein MMC14_007387 [Varicellaria rhodocarpa]|nr:hypothetical protein [Varicellaria rhodocarpa]
MAQSSSAPSSDLPRAESAKERNEVYERVQGEAEELAQRAFNHQKSISPDNESSSLSSSSASSSSSSSSGLPREESAKERNNRYERIQREAEESARKAFNQQEPVSTDTESSSFSSSSSILADNSKEGNEHREGVPLAGGDSARKSSNQQSLKPSDDAPRNPQRTLPTVQELLKNSNVCQSNNVQKVLRNRRIREARLKEWREKQKQINDHRKWEETAECARIESRRHRDNGYRNSSRKYRVEPPRRVPSEEEKESSAASPPFPSPPPPIARLPSADWTTWNSAAQLLSDPATASSAPFPDPPYYLCRRKNERLDPCLRGSHLVACHHDLKQMLTGSRQYSHGFLKALAVRFHPDRFSKFTEEEGVKAVMQAKAKDMFQMLRLLMEAEEKKEEEVVVVVVVD